MAGEIKERDFEAFEAGWNAQREYADHEWGPEPPKTARAAFAKWLTRCSQHHIIRIHGCTGTLPDGRECQRVNR
jgi:hypothetical protein